MTNLFPFYEELKTKLQFSVFTHLKIVAGSPSGNYEDDKISVLHVTSATFRKRSSDFDTDEVRKFNFANIYILSEFIVDVVQYIEGFVVKKTLEESNYCYMS